MSGIGSSTPRQLASLPFPLDGVVVGKGVGETVGAVDMVGLLDGGKVT